MQTAFLADMASKMLSTITIALVASDVLASADKEPETLGNKPEETQYREVIMYWTPSQIRAYEQNLQDEKSKAQIDLSLENSFNYNGSKYQQNRAEFERQTEQQKHYLYQPRENEKNTFNSQKSDKHLKQPLLQIDTPSLGSENVGLNRNSQNLEQHTEKTRPYLFVDVNQKLLQRHREQYQKHLGDHQKSQQLFYPNNDYLKQINYQNQLPHQYPETSKHHDKEETYQKYQLIPYEYVSENRQTHENLGKQILEQIKPRLILQDNDNSQLQQSAPRHEWHADAQQKPLAQQYAPNYSTQNYAYDMETLLNEIRMEKLQAQAKAEAIARSPPVVVQKDISIVRKRPTYITKTVNVPVPAPFLVPVPEPYAVQFPQPYPVPVEIIRPYAVPIVKTEKVEVEKPVPVEVEKQVPVVVEKKIYVKLDRPYIVERVVPVPVRREVPVEVPIFRPEKFTILRHVWER